MNHLKLAQAARLAGVSRSTMNRALNGGRVSYATDEHGQRWVDPAEIARAFPDSIQAPAADTVTMPKVVHEPVRNGRPETKVERENQQLEAKLLREMLERERELLERERGLWERERERDRELHDREIRDLRQRLDQANEERRALSMQLLPGRSSWWRWLRRRPPT